MLAATPRYWLTTVRAVRVHPAPEQARRLAEARRAKYGHDFGPDAYAAGCWALTPSRVIAWNALPDDATRFTWAPG